MFLVDFASKILWNIAKKIFLALLALANFHVRKSTFYGVWLYFSLVANLVWLLRLGHEKKNHLYPLVANLTIVNFLVIASCIGVRWIWNINIEFPGGDAFCKFTMWLQNSAVTIATAFMVYILILFPHPESCVRTIKENIQLMWISIPLLSIPQLLLFKTYAVERYNVTQCTVDQYVPEGYDEIYDMVKTFVYTSSVAILLGVHSFLIAIFIDFDKRQCLNWRGMAFYIRVVLTMLSVYGQLSILSLIFPTISVFVEYYNYALLESGSFFATANPILMFLILQNTPTEETVNEAEDSQSVSPSDATYCEMTIIIKITDEEDTLL